MSLKPRTAPNSEALRARVFEKKADGDDAFEYTRSDQTDLAAKFARIKRQLKKQAQPANVAPINARKKA